MGGTLFGQDTSNDNLEQEQQQERSQRVAADKRLQLQRLIGLRRRSGAAAPVVGNGSTTTPSTPGIPATAPQTGSKLTLG